MVAVIEETLRLYPPAFVLARRALAADTLCGQRVAPGEIVVISPWLLHRHRGLWTDPDAFDPGRFLPGAAPVRRFAYLPFGPARGSASGRNSPWRKSCWPWRGSSAGSASSAPRHARCCRPRS